MASKATNGNDDSSIAPDAIQMVTRFSSSQQSQPHACWPPLQALARLPVWEPPIASDSWDWSLYQCWYLWITTMTFLTLWIVPFDVAFSTSACAQLALCTHLLPCDS
jgi:hypothetical protein